MVIEFKNDLGNLLEDSISSLRAEWEIEQENWIREIYAQQFGHLFPNGDYHGYQPRNMVMQENTFKNQVQEKVEEFKQKSAMKQIKQKKRKLAETDTIEPDFADEVVDDIVEIVSEKISKIVHQKIKKMQKKTKSRMLNEVLYEGEEYERVKDDFWYNYVSKFKPEV
jgi:hypothetical protein